MLEHFGEWLVVQPAAPAVVALLVDRLWPRRRAVPARWIARPVVAAVRRLNRAERPAATRQARGFLLWIAVSLAALALGAAVARGLHLYLDPVWAMLAQALLLAAGIGYQGARSAARRAVDGVVQVASTRGLPQAEAVAETAIARLAVRFADGPMALVMAWLVLGLPGLFLIKAGHWLAHGVEADREGAFGRAVRACHGLITVPAGWLAGVLIGLGHLPPARVFPSPAIGALTAALDRAGLALAAPPVRVASARVVVDRAHALWLAALFAGSLIAMAI